MTQSNKPTIDVMNVTIAAFEGRKFYGHTIDKFGGDTHNALPEMKYHTSWDWLMPVVEKIDKEYACVRIQVGICTITYKYMELRKVAKEQGVGIGDVLPIAEHNEYGFIGNVVHAVYDFIDWLNQQKQKDEPGFDYKSRDWERGKSQPASEEAIKRMKERWMTEGKRECPDCGLWFKSEDRCPECNPLG